MIVMMMIPYWIRVLVFSMSLLPTLILAQDPGDQCLNKFTKGKDEFFLETDESVKDGAQFLGSPLVTQVKHCLSECCEKPECNLALMENGDQEGTIKTCFLFNCLYKQKQVCRFVRKKGFSNYVLSSVFNSYLDEYKPDQKDHPPKANAGQDRVVQPQDVVVLSGIESKDDHEITLFQWVQVSGSPGAILEKTNFPDEVKVSNLSSGVYKFRLTVTDIAGQSDSAEVTILVLTPEQSHHHCLAPKKIGPCRGSFPRWHYNALSEKCEKFTFGGCKPNLNNYLSEEECKQACDKVPVHPPSGRHGPIDPPTEECGVPCGSEKFTCANGCCIDKELECDQLKQCQDGSDEELCTYMDTKFRRLLDLDAEGNEAVIASHCTQPPVTGPCRDSTTKWYYNPYEMKCIRFNYGGCKGNDNQFNSEQECMKLCSKVTEKDAYTRLVSFEKQSQDGQSVSIAIAVALGLAILILVAVIGYCFLKDRNRRHSGHQHLSSNDTHIHIVEDTEKLVYNSTTKPK